MHMACTNIKCNYLRPGGFAQRLQFGNWLNGNCRLHHYILVTDESQVHSSGDLLTHSSHVCSD